MLHRFDDGSTLTDEELAELRLLKSQGNHDLHYKKYMYYLERGDWTKPKTSTPPEVRSTPPASSDSGEAIRKEELRAEADERYKETKEYKYGMALGRAIVRVLQEEYLHPHEQRISRLEAQLAEKDKDLKSALGRIKTLEEKPELSYQGVFVDGRTYQRGNFATFHGSLWFCTALNTRARPDENSNSKDWTLAAKRGRDGRDAKSREA
jgi:hypothetical protein